MIELIISLFSSIITLFEIMELTTTPEIEIPLLSKQFLTIEFWKSDSLQLVISY